MTDVATAAGGHERHAGDRESRGWRRPRCRRRRSPACPAVATARPAASCDRHAPSEELAVPGDEEQRVVDADAEADHAGHLRRPARDVDQVGQQRHRADPRGPARTGPCRSGAPSRSPTRTPRSRITTAAARPISSPCPGRSPRRRRTGRRSPRPASGEPSRASARASLSSSRSAALSSCSTGYCTRSTATSPSAETDPLATAASGPAPSAPAGSLVVSTLGSDATPACTSATRRLRAPESKKRGAVVERGHHHLGGQSGPVGLGRLQQLGGLRSSPAPVPRSVSSRSRPNATATPTTTVTAATTHTPITIHGRRAASRPNRKSADDMRSSLRRRASAHRSRHRDGWPAPPASAGPARSDPVDGTVGGSSFRPIRGSPWFPTLGVT